MCSTFSTQHERLCDGDGSLSEWFESLFSQMRIQGYVPRTVQLRQLHLTRFDSWIRQPETDRSGSFEEVIRRYLHKPDLRSKNQVRSSLNHFLEHLYAAGAIEFSEPPAAKRSAIDEHVEDFKERLLRNNLTDGSVAVYVVHARDFLLHVFPGQPVDLLMLDTSKVNSFVQHAVVRHSNPFTLSSVFTSLRSFLRYVRAIDSSIPDLTGAVPSVAAASMRSLPNDVSAEQTEKILATIDRSTPVGKRDYAIFMLLTQLGLRAIEIGRLKLDDIDWRQATFTVTMKGGMQNIYPLTDKIGEAIIDYLQHGRPQSSDREVFLRSRAPLGRYKNPTSFSGSLAKTIKRSGADCPNFGTHQFRHGVATTMLRHGATMGQISYLLGHRQTHTTEIYAKVDTQSLRKVVMPWPGGGA